jgi:hypothetical protein
MEGCKGVIGERERECEREVEREGEGGGERRER